MQKSLAGENLFWLVKSNLLLATRLLSWKFSVEPCNSVKHFNFSCFAGSCRNITCDCDKDKKEEEKPEKLAALFAKEFQDKLYRTIFTKDNDDKEPPTNKSILPTTTPTAYYNQSNCSNNAQVSSQGGEGASKLPPLPQAIIRAIVAVMHRWGIREGRVPANYLPHYKLWSEQL